MKPNYTARIISLLVLASAAMTAQVARQENVVPLKNWPTPLSWQPNQAESQALSQRAVPQLQFSANAVSTNALTFVAITPCRLVDTRGAAAGFNGADPFAGPSIASKATLTFPVQSPTEATANTEPAPCGVIPSIAEAYSFNVTVVPVAGGAVDYISIWPAGSAQPFVATLDDPQGAIVSNAAIVPAGPSASPGYGGVIVYNAGPASTNVIIDMNGYFTAPTDLGSNTAIGFGSMANNTSGTNNTATGWGALYANTTGYGSTATGYVALENNTTGFQNTADGVGALQANTTGCCNTATGWQALNLNAAGSNNTATGYSALSSNTSGYDNTATGVFAMQFNSTGFYNTATGFNALQSNTAGSGNTAAGYAALKFNTTGGANTATGQGALLDNTTGNTNTAYGLQSLNANTTGSGNIALGYQAGYNLITGSNNIDIGNVGVAADGAAANSGVIRIGAAATQTNTFIAGIYGATPNSANTSVCIDASGELGTVGCVGTLAVPSSRRFKEQIADMGDGSSNLLQLRPVTFLYKPQYDDGSHAAIWTHR